MTTLEAKAAARATATAWRWPPDIRPTWLDMSGRPTWSRSSSSVVLRAIPLRSRKRSPRGSQRGPGHLAPGVEVGRRPEVVEEREVLVDGLDAQGARLRRRVDGDRAPVHLDDAVVESVDAADALDERRLARAVVAEQREDLAAMDLQVHVLQRQDRAEALGRAADSDRRGRRRGGHARAAWATRRRPSR